MGHIECMREIQNVNRILSKPQRALCPCLKQLKLKVDDTHLFSTDIKDVCLSVHPTRHHGVALHDAQGHLYHKAND